MSNLSKIFTFDNFRFDTDKFALYHNDQLVKNVDKKTMQILAVLLMNPQKLTTHDEIIEQVWKDNPLGITSNHIGQYISKLRKIFAEHAPENSYIETYKGRGYSFIGSLSTLPTETPAVIKHDSSEPEREAVETLEKSSQIKDSKKLFRKPALLLAALVVVSLASLVAWSWFSQTDEEKIRNVVKDSQMYETLILYKNPTSFSEETLDNYWTPELDFSSNYDRQRIREASNNLIQKGSRYGDETKCERFEFQSVEINQSKDFAVVKTLEKWFIAVYSVDGDLIKNKYVGPYFVSYFVRKVDGRWLVEKSNTARMIRPTPRLTEVNLPAEIRSKQEFFVKIIGQDFEPEIVFIEVVGVGCPENDPCKVSNRILREYSKLSDTVLENVPLTLASGDFKIFARNGDSQVSNPITLTVP